MCLQDPVEESPAVLVKRHNISQQKHLELQLTAHQDVLERSVDLLHAACPVLVHQACNTALASG